MNLLKSLAAVSSMTMFSRVLGFARDAIVARIFGAGMATDAFFVAFKLPNLLRRIFAEGAFSQAFVPILAEYKSKQGEDATRVFVAYVSGLLTLALAVVTVAGMLAAPWVILVTAPGFADTADKFALTTQLLRITFPYILLISLASLVGAILNTWNRFSIPAFAPTFLNISMIGFALFAAPYFHPPVLALAWAVTVGGVLQLIYQLPHLKKIGMLVIQDQVWNKVSLNRGSKATRYYIDEFHLLLKDEQTAQYSVEIWKRFRKWGGIPTGITQNVKDLLMSKEIENIFDNTDFVLMLNQASGDRDILAKKLKISPFQLNYVTNSNAGEGLLVFGNTIVPFVDKFPKDTILYEKMTTKPEEVK